MIRSFSDKETGKLYVIGRSKKYPEVVCNVGIRKLDYLNGARVWMTFGCLPETGLGRDAGKSSIRINDQFRIVFKFIGSDAYDVEIIDYH